jgi:hypothetical protein
LPELIGGRALVFDLIGRVRDDQTRAGNQVGRFQQAIDLNLWHEQLSVSTRNHSLTRPNDFRVL